MYYALLTLQNESSISGDFVLSSHDQGPRLPVNVNSVYSLSSGFLNSWWYKEHRKRSRITWRCSELCVAVVSTAPSKVPFFFTTCTIFILSWPLPCFIFLTTYTLYCFPSSISPFYHLTLSANYELEPLLGTNYIAVNNTDTFSPNKD